MRRNQRIPADAGLQPERTELSWRRTLLALTVASIASTRVLHPLLGTWSLLPGACGVALAAAIAIATRHRFRRMHTWFAAHLEAGDRGTPAAELSGRLPLIISALIVLGALAALIEVLVVG